jgi:hypothetical protein
MSRPVNQTVVYSGVALILVGLTGLEVFAGSARESLSMMFGSIMLSAGVVTAFFSLTLSSERCRIGFVGIGLPLFAVAWLVVSFTVGGRGIVALAVAPDGTEMCVIETPGGETHQTGFYYRRPGQPWGWFYYEHEDSHWWAGRIRVSDDGKRAVVYRSFLPVAYFDLPTERFTIVRWNRALAPAQRWMPKDWRPEHAAKFARRDFSLMDIGVPDDRWRDTADIPTAAPR